MPGYTLGIGKGLSEPCSPYRTTNVFGAELNTPNASGWNCAPILVSPTTSFDLSTISKSHEVVVALLVAANTNGGATTIRFRWYRDRDNKLLFDYAFNISAFQGGWFYGYSYIGYVDWEISENGLYRVEAEVSGADTYQLMKYFTISGIPVVEPPPPPLPVPVGRIPELLNTIASYFYSIYLKVRDWIWPFSDIAAFFLYLSGQFTHIAGAFSDFITLVNSLISKVADVLSWDAIWNLIKTSFPQIETLRAWFYNWWTNIWNEVGTWWDTTWPTVKGWIDTATQGLNGLKVSWDNFWTITWPQWTSSLSGLKSAWDYFWTVIYPTLVDVQWAWEWWTGRAKEVGGLIDSKIKEAAPMWEGWLAFKARVAEFFTDPVEYIWERFVDWFLGPEG